MSEVHRTVSARADSISLPATAPRSARRAKMCFLKLLSSVDPDATHGFGFKGTFFRPGEIVGSARLRPSLEYPEIPIVLEQSLAPAHGIPGHRRCDTITILWRWDAALNEWRELGRSVSVGCEWAIEMRPLAIRALAEARGRTAALIDERAIVSRISEFLDHEVSVLGPSDRLRLLSVIHDQLAMRLCA